MGTVLESAGLHPALSRQNLSKARLYISVLYELKLAVIYKRCVVLRSTQGLGQMTNNLSFSSR